MDSCAEVFEGVVVFGAAAMGDVLQVDIYGSEACICGTVRFTFPVARRRATMLALLERWAAEAVPLTFSRSESSLALEAHGAGRPDQIRAST